MTAEQLLERTAGDLPGRLRWRVMEYLGICPASLRGRLLSRRGALKLACHMVLDTQSVSCQTAANPQFDMARFERLARS